MVVGTLGQLAASVNGSNSIHVVLPHGMGLRAADVALRRYGEVAHLEMLPSPVPTVACVFYDVRAALKAYEQLGAHFCQFVPQCGIRAARLPADMELNEADLRGVDSIDADLEESGAFCVHFFDTRDAARVRERAKKLTKAAAATKPQRGNLGSPSVKPFVPASFSAAAKPFVPSTSLAAHSKPSETPVVAAASPGGDQNQHVEVYLGGLPNSLCNDTCMDAVLEQAGLAKSLLSFRTLTGSPCGEVYVTLSDQPAAEQCLAHFHGRQWDTSGALVLAAVLPPVAKRLVSAEAKLSMEVPATKAKPASKATAKSSAAAAKAKSAVSSAANRAAKAPKTLAMPPGLPLPPGLGSCGSDYLSALSAAFDVTLEKPASAKSINVDKEPETESSTEAGISDEEECLGDEMAVAAAF